MCDRPPGRETIANNNSKLRHHLMPLPLPVRKLLLEMRLARLRRRFRILRWLHDKLGGREARVRRIFGPLPDIVHDRDASEPKDRPPR
jgi:hypothetical protein